jgi:hypothetical protein
VSIVRLTISTDQRMGPRCRADRLPTSDVVGHVLQLPAPKEEDPMKIFIASNVHDDAVEYLRADGHVIGWAQARQPAERDTLGADAAWICEHADAVAVRPDYAEHPASLAAYSTAIALGALVIIVPKCFETKVGVKSALAKV